MRSKHPIGVFDSGVGGLTVMQQITRTLPHEEILYFGDTARLPYGNKSRETIIRYSIENAIFLMERNIKLLVVACSTASAMAVEKLQQIFNIPVIGTIEPGAEKAAAITRSKRIGVLGTKGTINSGVYQKEICKRLAGAEIFGIACPLFVPLVEERFVSHQAAGMIVKEYLAPLKEKQVDTLVLGCTHYPLLRHLIEEEVGKDIAIVDSSLSCAEKVSAMLQAGQMARNENETLARHQFYVSDDPEKFRLLGQDFLGRPLEHVEAV